MNKRYALVTGGSKGIGKAICIQLARDGYVVIINYNHNHEAAYETLDLIHSEGLQAELLPFDVSIQEEVNTALSKWEELHQGEYIEVLINNVGVANNNLLLDMDAKQWHDVIDTNLNSFYYVTHRLLLEMVLHHNGRIINMSSILAMTGMSACVNYSAAKAALIGATKSLAVEVASKKITVNAVAPGAIDTDIIDTDFKQKILNHIPMRRLGKPEEVAHLVSFLCSDRASYISGQVIGVNGALL